MKKTLICVTRVSERKENETVSAGASEGGPHKKQVNLYLLFPLYGEKVYLYILLLMYVMQISFLNKKILLFVPVGSWQAFPCKSNSVC